MRYLAFLRGINVGGHNVKMEQLRAHFAELGLAEARTHIQSGNVSFEAAERDRESLARAIEGHLQARLGYPVPTFLRTLPELDHLLALDPFQHLSVTPEMRLCLVFTSGAIPHNLALPLFSPRRDVEIIHTTEQDAFVVWHLVDGRVSNPDSFLERTLGGKTTTRFFHTTARLVEAARQL
jgi:uncharacterized protein (DUF1697 family)